MTHKFEDAVEILKTSSMWDLGKHLPDIVLGMEDLLARLQVLEKKANAK